MTEKIALLTGCSSGIGLYCARTLSQRSGWRVFVSARQPADVERLQAEGLTALQLDLDSPDSIQHAVSELMAATQGRIDVLFNNGAYGQMGAVEDLSRTLLRAQFETNVFGTQELTNALLPTMRRQGHGRIIQNSSVLGFVAMRYRGAYVASKYALEALSDAMRLELHGSGIDVVLIEPGPIASEFRNNANKKFRQYFDDAAIAASPHHHYYQQRMSDEAPDPPFTLNADAVYRALLAAIEAKHPHRRYHVTVPTHVFWWFKRFLPTAWLDNILRRL
ncbi:MAG: SDR family NAD(P)-dependent oxidoreductase [Proteobacteria bacterium]|nr:SDR family NAD(P)-dependent oxidoreductase [Pseudomonadota bacterium]